MKNPLVSVIIPTFNRAYLIGKTLDSVLAQTYKNWECIIVDDFSIDSTLKLLEHYANKDKRFTFYSKSINDRKGASASRNIGLLKAKGEFIQFLDSDDVIAENKLEIQLATLLNERDSNIATCKWGTFIDIEEGKVYEENLFYKNFESPLEYFQQVGKFGGFLPLHCFLIPLKIIEKAGYWCEDLSLSDDSEFIFRVLINVDKILFCPGTNVLYRKGDLTSLSTKKTIQNMESLILSWKKIENSYSSTFGYGESSYLDNKKEQVYKSVKKLHPKLIKENEEFFKKQIKLDDDEYNIRFNCRRIRNKILYLMNKYIKM